MTGTGAQTLSPWCTAASAMRTAGEVRDMPALTMAASDGCDPSHR
jgi:hypothetical protein